MTHFFEKKASHEEELCQIRESISGEVEKAMEAPNAEEKKQVEEASHVVGIL